MIIPTELLTTPAARALGWTLLHFLWQGALIASALRLLLALFKKHSPQLRYALGLAAFLMMALAPPATFIYQYNLARTPPAAIVSPHPISPWIPLADELPPAEGTVAQREILQLEPVPRPFLSRLELWTPALAAFWFCGALFLSLRLFAGWLQLFWLHRFHAEAAGPFWEQKLENLKQRLRLRRKIKFLQSTRVEVPAVLGWIRPVILFPAGSFSGLTPSQLEAILAHELSHVRRHDCLVNLLQVFLETVLFYHPAVWWVSKRIRQEREYCCDDCAVAISGDPVAYVRALTALEELRGYPSALALAATDGSLLRRARRILGLPRQSGASAAWAVISLLIFLAIILCLLPAGGIVAAETPTPPPPAARSPETLPEIVDFSDTNTTAVISDHLTGQRIPTPPQKAIFYNDRTGVLLVRATMEDHNLIERAVQMIANSESDRKAPPLFTRQSIVDPQNSTPPVAPPSAKLKFNIQFAEIKFPGLESWLEIFQSEQSSTDPNAVPPSVPPSSSAEILTMHRTRDGAHTNRATSSIARLSTPWILNPHRAKQLLQALQQKTGVDLLSGPAITTLSGRQAQIKSTEAKNIVTGVQTNSTGVTFQPETIDFGSTIDLIPHLSADSSKIDLQVSGGYFEFLGYDDPGPSGTYNVVLENGQTMAYPLPLPRFRQREFTALASIPPGDTLVVYGGGGETENITRAKSKVPLLGDIPLLGRLFRTDELIKSPSHFIILITSELLDE